MRNEEVQCAQRGRVSEEEAYEIEKNAEKSREYAEVTVTGGTNRNIWNEDICRKRRVYEGAQNGKMENEQKCRKSSGRRGSKLMV